MAIRLRLCGPSTDGNKFDLGQEARGAELVDVERQVDDFELEALGRERGDGAGSHVQPSAIGGVRDRVVEIEKKLVGAAADGRHLAEGETQADGFFKQHALGFDIFVFEQGDEAAAAGMRPDFAAQEIAQFEARAEGDFALADPFDDGVAPMPMAEQAEVLIDEVEREVHFAALYGFFAGEEIGREKRDHVFLLDDLGGDAHHLVEAFHLGHGLDEERRQFMRLAARHFYESSVPYDVHKQPR